MPIDHGKTFSSPVAESKPFICRGKMYVCSAAEISEGVGVADSLKNIIHAKHLVCRMPGGSQSILVRGDDEELYVVKFNNNLQGPNLLANEVLGSELLRSVGLRSSPWKAISITAEFLKSNPNIYFECATGTRYSINSGLHFGAAFVGSTEKRDVYDFLPSSFLHRIGNPADFLGIYIFDVWANHHDHRQAVYACRTGESSIDVHFIDNGHLFGGPHWKKEQRYGVAMCLDQNLYRTPWRESVIDEWISHFEISLSKNLHRAIRQVPKGWYKGDINSLATFLEFRLRNLRELFRQEVRHNRRINSDLATGFSDASLLLCGSRPLQIRSGLG